MKNSTPPYNAIKILRVIVVSLVALSLFTPLIVGDLLYFPFITGKAFYMRAFIELALAVYIVLAVIDPASRPRRSPLLIVLGFFLLILAASLYNSVNPIRSFWSNFERMEGFVTMLHLGALFVVASATIKKREWAWLGGLSLVISVIVGAMALGDITAAVAKAKAGGVAGVDLEAVKSSVRISGTLGNSSYLGIYALIHTFFAFLGALMIYRGNREAELMEPGSVHKPKSRLTVNQWLGFIVFVLVMIFNLYVFFKTGTRSSFGGLVAGLVVTGIYLAWKEKDKIIRFAALGVVVAVFVSVIGLGIFKNSSLIQSSPLLSRYASLVTWDINSILGKLEARTTLWSMAYQGVKEKPILGWGQDNFGYVFAKHYNPNMYAQEQWFDRSHNVFLDWLVAAGFLGLLGYLSLFGLAVWLLLSKKSAMTVIEKAVFLGLFTGYFIHNLFVFDNLSSYLMFFLLLAYIHDRYTHDRVAKESSGIKDYGTIILGTSFAVVLVFSYTMYKSVFEPLAQNRTLVDSMNQIASQAQVTPELAPKVKRMPADLAYDSLRKVFTLGHVGENEAFEQLSNTSLLAIGSPTVSEKTKMNFYNLFQERIGYHNRNNAEDPRYAYFITNFYNRLGMTDKAYEYAKKAYDLSPNKQSFAYTLAITEAQRGDMESATAHIKKAYEDAPENRDAFGYYTSVLFDAAKLTTGKYDIVKLEKVIQLLAEGYLTYGHDQMLEPKMWNILKQTNQLSTAKLIAKRLGELVPDKKAELDMLAK